MPYTGVPMSVTLVRLHVLVKILFRPYLRVSSSIGDIDLWDLPLADPSTVKQIYTIHILKKLNKIYEE